MFFDIHVGFDHVPRLFCVEGKFQVLRRANSACSSGTQSTWRDASLECFKLQVHLTGLVTQRCGSAWPAATRDPLLPEQVGFLNIDYGLRRDYGFRHVGIYVVELCIGLVDCDDFFLRKYGCFGMLAGLGHAS